jgi:asparagine synthase (glutamine-hydrolysing)
MLTKLPYTPEDKSEILRLLDIRFFLEGDILQKVDRLSMANSLEVRVPFLDHRIVEYSNSLTYDKLFGKIRKYPIKKILEKYFNKDFVHRSKIGFMLNVGEWIDNFDGWVSKSNALKTEVFVKNFNIKKVKDKYLKFAILMFCLWYEENYD